MNEFKNTHFKILFIRGVISEDSLENQNPDLNLKNYLFGKALQEAINCSRYIISRPGYTTLMDLAKLEKKAFFIPTPGQGEQEYLARRLKKLKIAPYCEQNEFSLSKLDEIKDYQGLSNFGNHPGLGNFFTFFQSE